jgi:hypothetical protein
VCLGVEKGSHSEGGKANSNQVSCFGYSGSSYGGGRGICFLEEINKLLRAFFWARKMRCVVDN